MAPTGTGTGKCLPAGAMIDLCERQRKKIVELTIGDQVWGLAHSYKLAKQTVVGIQENGIEPLVRIKTFLGAILKCTENHPLLRVSGWTEAGKLAVGDQVALPRTIDVGKTVRDEEFTSGGVCWDSVVEIEKLGPEMNYDIELAPDHNFVADGVVTHNTFGVSIAVLTCCALYPGFNFLNLAFKVFSPSCESACVLTFDGLVAQLQDPCVIMQAAIDCARPRQLLLGTCDDCARPNTLQKCAF